MIDDPRRPFRIKLGVPYRVEKVEGELVVREMKRQPWHGMTTAELTAA